MTEFLSSSIGYVTLSIFLITVVLALFRKITLPIQTILVLVTLIMIVIGIIERLLIGGIESVLLLPNEILGGIIVHPITALLAGLLLAGALDATGGFEAIKAILLKLKNSPLGLAGTLAILVNLPLLAQLPCGRILAAAMLPLLFSFGAYGMRILGRDQIIVLVAAFARNAFASCGPSPIGGVGQSGEGVLGAFFPTASNGILRGPESLALMIGTSLMALFVAMITPLLYPEGSSLRDPKTAPSGEAAAPEIRPPLTGYISLLIFFAALLISLFQPLGKMPVQSVLVAAALLMLVILALKRGFFKATEALMGGIILLPASAMIAGFMAAGALAATGGFDALGSIMNGLSQFALLGVAGMLAIFVQLQTIIPLACSRILVAALVPVLYLFGPAQFNLINWEQLAIVMAAFIINATASCAPSPVGGAGMMAEGTLRAETGYLKAGFSFVSMAIMAPIAAFTMKLMTLHSFTSGEMGSQSPGKLLLSLGLTVVVGIAVMKGMRWMAILNRGRAWSANFAGFLLAGILAGGSLAFAVFGLNGISLFQGGVGGGVAACLIALMTPRTLVA
ncbi:MAG: hypothetical protein JXA73_04525 [Acidobacteria bacterium]|nr:hypothetical protein [Acidobacteriota bacterium]